MKRGILGVVLLAASALACGSQGAEAGTGEATSTAPKRVVPRTREAFLARLSPLPSPELALVYEISGPGGIAGSLEILAREGGYRRQNWNLRVKTEQGELVDVRGSTIQTPDVVWSGLDGQAGETSPTPLGQLADAYLEADPEARRKIVDGLAQWRLDLEAARKEHPGDVETILDTPCLRTRIAAQSLCLWERTGLPLRYDGAEFRLEATRIDRVPRLDESAFELPPEAQGAKKVAGPELDAAALLERLAAGDYGELAILLAPSLRIPG